MNDNDRALVEQVLHAAGTAGTQGWDYLIRFMVVDGIVGALFCIAFIAAGIYLLRRLFRWKASGSDADTVAFVRGIGIVAVCGLIVAFTCCLSDDIVQVIQPQGAAIHKALHHH